MKKYPILFFVLGFYVFGSLHAQKDYDIGVLQGDFVMMRSSEAVSDMNKSKLVISDGRDKPFIAELGLLRPATTLNVQIIPIMLNKIKAQGYILTSVTSQDLGGVMLITDYIFEKKSP